MPNSEILDFSAEQLATMADIIKANPDRTGYVTKINNLPWSDYRFVCFTYDGSDYLISEHGHIWNGGIETCPPAAEPNMGASYIPPADR